MFTFHLVQVVIEAFKNFEIKFFLIFIFIFTYNIRIVQLSWMLVFNRKLCWQNKYCLIRIKFINNKILCFTNTFESQQNTSFRWPCILTLTLECGERRWRVFASLVKIYKKQMGLVFITVQNKWISVIFYKVSGIANSPLTNSKCNVELRTNISWISYVWKSCIRNVAIDDLFH